MLDVSRTTPQLVQTASARPGSTSMEVEPHPEHLGTDDDEEAEDASLVVKDMVKYGKGAEHTGTTKAYCKAKAERRFTGLITPFALFIYIHHSTPLHAFPNQTTAV